MIISQVIDRGFYVGAAVTTAALSILTPVAAASLTCGLAVSLLALSEYRNRITQLPTPPGKFNLATFGRQEPWQHTLSYCSLSLNICAIAFLSTLSVTSVSAFAGGALYQILSSSDPHEWAYIGLLGSSPLVYSASVGFLAMGSLKELKNQLLR